MTSKRKKTRPDRETGCCPVEVKPFETPLSKTLMQDPFPESGAIHDVDPFGVYQNNANGQAVFKQVIRCRPDYVVCKEPNELDALICRVFLAAAKHGHRYMVITKTHLRSFARGQIFSGSPIQGGEGGFTVVPALPYNVVLCVSTENPQDLGRLCYSCGRYGVSLIDPHRVCALEVVPAPFGYARNEGLVLT